METRWPLVGSAVVAAREAKGWLQADLIRESGVSDATIRKIERGHSQAYRTDIKRAVEDALDWPTGHIDHLLRGDPAVVVTQLDDDERPATRRELADLVTAVDLLRAVVDQMQAQWQGAVDDAVAEVERRAHPRARPSSGGQS